MWDAGPDRGFGRRIYPSSGTDRADRGFELVLWLCKHAQISMVQTLPGFSLHRTENHLTLAHKVFVLVCLQACSIKVWTLRQLDEITDGNENMHV